MIVPNSYQEIATYVEKGKNVFFFTANWCGDCRFIEPALPEIEADFPMFRFVKIDRDQFLDLAIQWHIVGIPSLVIIEDGQERGRLVNKKRKTKTDISHFLAKFQ